MSLVLRRKIGVIIRSKHSDVLQLTVSNNKYLITMSDDCRQLISDFADNQFDFVFKNFKIHINCHV